MNVHTERNWSISETKELFALVYKAAAEGKGLSAAFSAMAKASGKSINSIRNYYYSQLRLFEMMPSFAAQLGIKTVGSRREAFVAFTPEETDALVETVLVGKAAGRSVRAVIAEMSHGDKKLALRLQNKYRSMLTCHRDKVRAVMARLSAAGKAYYDPYLRRTVTDGAPDDNVTRLAEYISKLDGERVADVVRLLLGRPD